MYNICYTYVCMYIFYQHDLILCITVHTITIDSQDFYAPSINLCYNTMTSACMHICIMDRHGLM